MGKKNTNNIETFNIEEVLDKTMKNCKYFYNKEEGFRLDIARAIDKKYKGKAFIMCEFSDSKNGKNKSIDMIVCYNNKKYAIELKYRIYKYNSFKNMSNSYLDYKTTEGCNMCEYINDIKTRVIDINFNKDYDNVFAILLTNHKEFRCEKEIKKYIKTYNTRCDVSESELKKINIKRYDIKDGYYKKNKETEDFYIVWAEKAQEKQKNL